MYIKGTIQGLTIAMSHKSMVIAVAEHRCLVRFIAFLAEMGDIADERVSLCR